MNEYHENVVKAMNAVGRLIEEGHTAMIAPMTLEKIERMSGNLASAIWYHRDGRKMAALGALTDAGVLRNEVWMSTWVRLDTLRSQMHGTEVPPVPSDTVRAMSLENMIEALGSFQSAIDHIHHMIGKA